MKNKITYYSISIAFLVVAIANVYGNYTSNMFLETMTKPFITCLLVLLYVMTVNKRNFWYVSGLFFSFWGDVLLSFGDEFFVIGLASFLLAHVMYITVVSKSLQKVSVSKILLHSLPFLMLLGVLLYVLYPNLGELLIPVIVYGVVISIFGVVAFLVYTQERSTANLWLFLGAVIFISSDSILALNKFHESHQILRMLVMVAYITAQYLICKSMIAKHGSSEQ